MLPIGIENFEEMVTKNFWYADKTLLIKDLLDNQAKVRLITRPRRFGKTLNMSMLQCFFDCTMDSQALFKDLAISKAGDEYLAHMNQYPVIFLSLKEAKKLTFEESITAMMQEFKKEYKRHDYLLTSDKTNGYFKQIAQTVIDRTPNDEVKSGALYLLCDALYQHWGKKVIILLDEYDVPLESSYSADDSYYRKMVDYLRGMMGAALKTNNSLEFAVITGCLRISKESIFTGLNNFAVNTILNNQLSPYFGLTNDEVTAGLKEYGLLEHENLVQNWYNGYLFGNTRVYNPWSVIQFISDMSNGEQPYDLAYWANTSSNDIVRTFFNKAGENSKAQIETLLNGGTLIKSLRLSLTYDEIYGNPENLWDILFFTGYLTMKQKDMKIENNIPVPGTSWLELEIPNLEVKAIYLLKFKQWFSDTIENVLHEQLYQALFSGDTLAMTKELNGMLIETVSFIDSAENFYHGFMVGVLSSLSKMKYFVKSNRETGKGRCDIIVYSSTNKSYAAILELKVCKEQKELAASCDEALAQIERNNYQAELESMLFTKENIHKFGIAFCGKECAVRMGV
jgi:hypothetical protein